MPTTSGPVEPPVSGVSSFYRNTSNSIGGYDLGDRNTVRSIGFLKLRGQSDDLPQSWWFASTAIPLLAATTGPMSNVLSIAALVTPWRVSLPDNGTLPAGADDNGVGIPDPHWEIILNACSLAFGFAGNFFLMLNFTGRVRYIISLPLSILFWFLASGILMAITISMHIYLPPVAPGEIYSQGYWYAVFAATFYVLGSFGLMINMTGYALGHYPQKFDLDDHQRTLILQTMMYFFWLAAGAGIFVRIEGWTYVNSLYLCDVPVLTASPAILTVGFGDLSPQTSAGRGFLFVFELLGIIQLGLAINSISKFAGNISADKIIKGHQKHKRESTIGRTVTSEKELREKLGLPPRRMTAALVVPEDPKRQSMSKYGHIEIHGRTIKFREKKAPTPHGGRGGAARRSLPLSRDAKVAARSQANKAHEKRHRRRQNLLLLKEEKDRFEAMREIEEDTRRFQQYYSLFMAILAFGILWCIGALVFFVTEHRLQGFTYFDALYFCFVSLLTIGFGDISPKSNLGKPFFVIWSLIAVPTMTVLIQEMSNTVVAAINRATFALADWTVLPRKGVVRDFVESHPRLHAWLRGVSERQRQKRRLKEGFQVQEPDEDPDLMGTNAGGEEPSPEETEKGLERLTRKASSDHDLARELAIVIKKVAHDLSAHPPVRYSYEQWVHFTQLIRFSTRSKDEVEALEDEEGLVEWDWIGEDSPMLADETEAQWVLDRLCESLNRYTRKQAAKAAGSNRNRQSAPTGLDLPGTTAEEEGNGGPSTDPPSPALKEKEEVASPDDDRQEIKLWAARMGSRVESPESDVGDSKMTVDNEP